MALSNAIRVGFIDFRPSRPQDDAKFLNIANQRQAYITEIARISVGDSSTLDSNLETQTPAAGETPKNEK